MRKAIGLLAVLVYTFSVAAAPPVKVVGMKRADFDKLPADTLLDVGGRTLTKAALLAEIGVAGKGPAPGLASGVGASKAGTKFIEAEKGRLSAQKAAINAKRRPFEVSKAAPPPKVIVKPTITSVEPQVIEPGVHVLVNGIGFGEDAGEVRVVGNFPGSSYTLRTCNQGICTWYPSEIVGEVRDISGVLDQSVNLVVVTKSGATSAPFPVQFRARRVQSCDRVVGISSVQVTPASQGPCHQRQFTYDQPSMSMGVWCIHKTDVLIAIGADRVSVNLKNGWVLTGYGIYWDPAPDTMVMPAISFTSGSPSMWASISWIVFPKPDLHTNYASWWMDMCAVGPVGVPFK